MFTSQSNRLQNFDTDSPLPRSLDPIGPIARPARDSAHLNLLLANMSRWCPTGRGDGSHYTVAEYNALKAAATKREAEARAQAGIGGYDSSF